MTNVLDFDQYRRARSDAGKLDPEKTAVFPGVSLADLWRIWARCETERKRVKATATVDGSAAGLR